MLRDRDGIGIRDAARSGADITSCLDNLVKGRAVHHKVTDHRESLGAPWFNPNVVAVVELAHVQLAGGDAIVVAVRPTVDIEPAHAADTFTTVVVETNGMGDPINDKPLIQDI